MYTGIISAIAPIQSITNNQGIRSFGILFDEAHLKNLRIGASVACNGVCLTVTTIEDHTVHFDTTQETLSKTNLKQLEVGSLVNIERSAKYGDENGGHALSGHIDGTLSIHSIDTSNNNWVITLAIDPSWTRYLFPKGFIGLNGASLTIAQLDREQSTFTVSLIPETLRQTTFADLKAGALLNFEIERQTQVMVDTIWNALEHFKDKEQKNVNPE